MKLSDLDFMRQEPFVVPNEHNEIVLEDNTVVDLHPLSDKSLPHTYLLNGNPVTLSPKDSAALTRFLEEPAPRKYFFMVDHSEENRIYISPYLVSFEHSFADKLTICCRRELLNQTSEEKLKGKFLCQDDFFKQPTIFLLRANDTADKNVQKCMLVSESEILLVEAVGGVWEVVNKIQNNHNEMFYDWHVICVHAPDFHFAESASSKEFNALFDESVNVMKAGKSFIELWNAYEKMEEILLKEQEESIGAIAYESYRMVREGNGNVKFTFTLKDGAPRISDLKKMPFAVWDGATEKTKRGALVAVGTFSKMSGERQLETVIDQFNEHIPNHAYLTMNISGDEKIHKRRKKAKDVLENPNRCPLPNLLQIINQAGNFKADPNDAQPPVKLEEKHKGLTATFKDKFPEAKRLNDAQQVAVTMAINTPDIAVIKGPPGTGKTTVIRTIIRRFLDIHENEDALVAISSFQNTAVDNAIKVSKNKEEDEDETEGQTTEKQEFEGREIKDFPAFRVISKKNPNDDYSRDVETWAKKCTKKMRLHLQDPTFKHYSEQLKKLAEKYQSFCNADRPLQEGQAILREYLDTFSDYIQSGMKHQINQLIQPPRQTARSWEDELPEELSLKKLLQLQPLNRKAFEDGGLDKVKKLYNFMLLDNTHADITETIKSKVRDLVNLPAGSDAFEGIFKTFVEHIKSLQKTYCPPVEKDNTVEEIDALIQVLPKEIERLILRSSNGTEGRNMAESFIAAQFLDRFEKEYPVLIKKYSNVLGVTCQKMGSYSVEEKLEGKEFDLVIVDEAARAIPLDLFIPLSKAKKIILVGDQDQLNHMLNEKIKRKLEKDKNLSGKLELLKTSLFEKLFEYLKGQGKAIALEYQFRYNDEICKFVSEEFYGGAVKTGNLDPKKVTPKGGLYNNKPLVAIDVAGPEEEGRRTSEKENDLRKEFSSSIKRPVEVEQIIGDVKYLLQNHPKANIGIITFYLDQKKLLAERVANEFNATQQRKIHIGTVDSFQGKEYEYIFLSCVRSNRNRRVRNPETNEVKQEPAVGFLNDEHRLCVAFSRAIRQLIVYGDKSTVTQIKCFQSLYTPQYEQSARVIPVAQTQKEVTKND